MNYTNHYKTDLQHFNFISKEEKEIKQQYGHVWHKNLPEEKKKAWWVSKNIIKWEKALCYNYKVLFFSKINNLESSFDKKYKDVLKNQFRSYICFRRRKSALKSWFKWKKKCNKIINWKIIKKLKLYIKWVKKLESLMTLKLNNTNFINIKTLFW